MPRTLKRDARVKLMVAVQSGRIRKPPKCSKCGKVGAVEGHHADYSRPLDVIWLCRLCHSILHDADRPRRLRKRLTIWVLPEKCKELKQDAKLKGLLFSFYLEKLLEDAWSRRNV